MILYSVFYRSESGSSEDETRVRRKLGPALSVPAYTSYTAYTQPLSLRYRVPTIEER